MKKIFTFLAFSLLLTFSANLAAQTAHPFELGLNAGASWLKSDVKMKKLGFGWGATFGQTYCMNSTSPLMWGWRFRYLNANTYGQGYDKSSGIANNAVLNGSIDSSLDYNSNPGYVYQNYKTHLDEVSVELLLGANRLRERTNLYPYIFGGVGITKAVAKTNQLDENNLRYDYTLIDPSAGKANILSSLNDLQDGSYESLAEGSTGAKWKFMPSFGVGLGYEVVKGFSIGLEHKMTWGLNDVLDGQKWSNSNTSTGNNDMYHYSSVWIKFSFGRGSHTHSATTTTTTTTTSDTYTSAPAVAPVIMFSNPATPGTTVSTPAFTIKGKISDINSAGDMTMTVNGNPVTGFSYNPSTDVFSYPVVLQSFATTIVVTATNASGSTNESTTIIYSPVVETPPAPQPPVITITDPNRSPVTTNMAGATITGGVQNIGAKSQMQVTANGVAISSFNYNAPAHAFTINSNLMPGANTFVITASNAVGTDSKSVTVIFQPMAEPPPVMMPPPVITITSPGMSPYTSAVNTVNVSATVLNVESRNAITVKVNGIIHSDFTYSMGTKVLNYNMSLVNGANTIEIEAVNAAGNDSRSQTVIYSQPVTEPKPVVTISNPAASPYNTAVSSANVTATVLHVASLSQISVTFNGSGMPAGALNFNAASHQLTFNANLIVGANTVVITAGNASGSDSKTATIIYTKPAVVLPAPVVTFTNPSASPFNVTVNTMTVNATVMNVLNTSQIAVTLNGAPTTAFTYNPASHQLALNATLIAGANVITITASNASGNDSKTATIIYREPVVATPEPVLPPPVVSFLTPATTPQNVTTGTYTVTAKVTNVTAASQITLKFNGVNVTTFSFMPVTKKVTFNATLIEGANTVIISGTNASGTDSKTSVINYTKPVKPATVDTAQVVNPETSVTPIRNPGGAHTVGGTHAGGAAVTPDIIILTPASATATTTDAVYTISAKIENLGAAGTIDVTIRGTAFTGYSYNASTKILTVPVSIMDGVNTVIIQATNSAGSFGKKVVITK